MNIYRRKNQAGFISLILCCMMLFSTMATFAETPTQDDMQTEMNETTTEELVQPDQKTDNTLDDVLPEEEQPSKDNDSDEQEKAPQTEEDTSIPDEESSESVLPETINPLPPEPKIAYPPLSAFYIKYIEYEDSSGKPYNKSFKQLGISTTDYSEDFYDAYPNNVKIYVRVEGNPTNGYSAWLNQEIVHSSATIDEVRQGNIVVAYTSVYDIQLRDPEQAVSTFSIRCQAAAPNFNILSRDLKIHWKSDKTDAPTTPAFVYDTALDQYILTGVDSSMEYRLTNAANPNLWTPCTDDTMGFEPGTSANYYVRYAETESTSASKTKTIQLPGRANVPSISYNSSTELFGKYTPGVEMKVNEGEYFGATEAVYAAGATPYIDQIASGDTSTLKLRFKKTETQPASHEATVTLYPRTAKPTGISYDPASLLIKGVSSAMQYKDPTDNTWKSISTTTIAVENYMSSTSEIPILIRNAATSKESASDPITIMLPKINQTIVGNIDYKQEVINGLELGVLYQYRVGNGGWYDLVNKEGTFSISNLVSTSADVSIYIRKKRISSTDTPNEARLYILPKRSQSPAGFSLSYTEIPEKGVLSQLNGGMEYKLSTATPWTEITDNQLVFTVPASGSQIYYIRNKSTDTSFASANAQVTLSARGGSPGVSYNATTEIIYSLRDDTMEWSFNGAPYKPVEKKPEYSTSKDIDTLAPNMTTVINVRLKATEKAPASLPRTITLYARSAAPTTVSYNPTTFSLQGVSTTMEYKGPDDTAWKSISSTIVKVENYASASADVIIQVRLKSTSKNSASKSVEITIPKLVNAPNGSLNYIKEAITGLDPTAVYQYTTSPTNTSWGTRTNVNGIVSISDLISTSDRTIYLRKAATAQVPASASTAYTIPKRPAVVSPTPTFKYNDIAYPEKAVMSGLTSAMEYKLLTATQWISAPDGNLILDIPAVTETYYVRWKGTEEAFASSTLGVNLLRKGSAPSIGYDGTTEILSSLNNNSMEWSFGNAAYTPLGIDGTTYNVTDKINALALGQKLDINIRNKATLGQPSSLPRTITLYSRLAAPTTVTYDSAAFTLRGVSSAMQYKGPADTAWKNITTTTVNVESYAKDTIDVVIQVRFKSTAANSASKSAQVTIPKLIGAPTGVLNYAQEVITGLEPTAVYQYGTSPTGTAWSARTNTNGAVNISDLITASDRTIYLRKAATAQAPASAATPYVIPKRPLAVSPLPVFVYNDPAYPEKAIMSGLAANMEYKLSSATQWSTASDGKLVLDIPTANQTYYVRLKSTETAFASSNATVTLLKNAVAPTITYNGTTESMSQIFDATMEFSFGGSAYGPVVSNINVYNVTDRIDALKKGEKLEIRIRNTAKATAPASLPKIITLYSRLTPPTTVTYDVPTFTIKGVSSAMQYKAPSDTAWRDISATTLNTAAAATDQSDVVYQIRFKSTATGAASNPIQVVIPKLTNAPNGTIDYKNESISGLDPTAVYQYGLSPTGTSWNSRINLNGSVSIADLITTSEKTIYLRKAGTANTPATAAAQYVLAKRPPAMGISRFKFVYNDPAHLDKAVLTGLDSSMEYRLSTDKPWISSSGETAVLDITDAIQIYYIRLKGTDTEFPANNTDMRISARAKSPAITNYPYDEIISKLNSSNMEWSFNDKPYEPIEIESTSYGFSDKIDELTSGQKFVLKIRYKATETLPASMPYIVTYHPRAAVPTTLGYDSKTKKLTGVNRLMHYRKQGWTPWTDVTTSGSEDVSSYLKYDKEAILEVQVKYVSGVNSCSKIVPIRIYTE